MKTLTKFTIAAFAFSYTLLFTMATLHGIENGVFTHTIRTDAKVDIDEVREPFYPDTLQAFTVPKENTARVLGIGVSAITDSAWISIQVYKGLPYKEDLFGFRQPNNIVAEYYTVHLQNMNIRAKHNPTLYTEIAFKEPLPAGEYTLLLHTGRKRTHTKVGLAVTTDHSDLTNGYKLNAGYPDNTSEYLAMYLK